MPSELSNPIGANRRLHAFAVLTACCTLLLIVAGALVTGNDAGLAVPDWPLSYGTLTPPMIGGIRFEHGHRLVAMFVGLLTCVLAVWLWRRETRPHVKKLGLLGLEAVVSQGVLGGITVLFFLPAAVSVLHATLAQTFFCLMAVLALITGSGWSQHQYPESDVYTKALRPSNLAVTGILYALLFAGVFFRNSDYQPVVRRAMVGLVACLVVWTVSRIGVSLAGAALGTESQKRLAPPIESRSFPLHRLVVFTLAAIYVQLILGAIYRHSRTGLLWHVLWAFLVCFLVVWTVAHIHKFYSQVAPLFRPAMIVGLLLAVQVSLGVGAYWVHWMSRDEIQPDFFMVAITTAHVATGALLLLSSVVLTLQSLRLISPGRRKLPVHSAPREVIL